MQKKITPVVLSILEAIDGIDETIEDRTYQEFCDTWFLRHSVQRGIEIISEASRRLPNEIKAEHPNVDWRKVHSIGNILRHEYHRVQDKVIWEITQSHLPYLRAALMDILEKHNEDHT